jgi:glycyl-tRNA synthetase
MSYDEIYKLALEHGFFSPSCEIYSDFQAGFWEYGPLGVALKNNYVNLWRRELVRRDGMIEIDGTQIMSKNVFVASGHLESFADPIVVCTKCGTTTRADRMISERAGISLPEGLPEQEYDALIAKHNLRCTNCKGDYGKVKKFNMMFRVGIGPKDDDAYLRPETCQSIFVDAPRLFKTMRLKLPIGFAQFGKSFRNEIAPRQSLVRLREFYQCEIEVFFNPKKADDLPKFQEVKDVMLPIQRADGTFVEVTAEESVNQKMVPNQLVAYYLAMLKEFYDKTGIDTKRARFRELSPEDRAFYAVSAFDFEVQTSLGWMELVACNYRSDYDMGRHGKISNYDVTVLDGNEKVLPHIFEISMGVDRSIYCVIEHAYAKENDREVLRIKPQLAPTVAGIFPLVNKDGLPEKAQQIYQALKRDFSVFYDESGSIGRRYRRQDEVGTPVCITVDYDTMKDGTVTLRNRDTMSQQRIKIEEIPNHLSSLVRVQN